MLSRVLPHSDFSERKAIARILLAGQFVSSRGVHEDRAPGGRRREACIPGGLQGVLAPRVQFARVRMPWAAAVLAELHSGGRFGRIKLY